MGYWKDVWTELEGGNAEAHHDESACATCFDDEGLSGFVEGNASENTCTFCGATSTDPIALPLDKILLYVNRRFRDEYDIVENWPLYDGESGSFFGKTWTTEELLEEHLECRMPNDDGRLMEALQDGLGQRTWCRRAPFSLTMDETLTYSWEAFCKVVKHHKRYFFLRKIEDQEMFSPLGLLRELEGWCKKLHLIETLPENHVLYRARYQKSGEHHRSASELGPPPVDKATMANRMSPPGIVMFYVSDDAGTALREVARHPETDAGRYAIGEFQTLRDIRILDLTIIPPVPSIFESAWDTLEYNPRPPLIFLRYFAAELSMPVARDRNAHVEYIPAQVVTEYFRTEFTDDDGPLAGIRYRSARHEEGTSLVLFASQHNLVGASAEEAFQDRDAWIELVGRDQREVAAEDLKRWNQEAPQTFD